MDSLKDPSMCLDEMMVTGGQGCHDGGGPSRLGLVGTPVSSSVDHANHHGAAGHHSSSAGHYSPLGAGPGTGVLPPVSAVRSGVTGLTAPSSTSPSAGASCLSSPGQNSTHSRPPTNTTQHHATVKTGTIIILIFSL